MPFWVSAMAKDGDTTCKASLTARQNHFEAHPAARYVSSPSVIVSRAKLPWSPSLSLETDMANDATYFESEEVQWNYNILLENQEQINKLRHILKHYKTYAKQSNTCFSPVCIPKKKWLANLYRRRSTSPICSPAGSMTLGAALNRGFPRVAEMSSKSVGSFRRILLEMYGNV